MNIEQLIAQGNDLRAQHKPLEALKCYAEAFIEDPESAAAWNNYGNVLRECGHASRSIPFLQHAIALDPNNSVAQFNLAVAYLAVGNYQDGWRQYEHRWNYEHLAGSLPKYTQPRWLGQEIKGKTILVQGEQGHGDNIQFVRFIYNLHELGAAVKLKVTDGLIPLFAHSPLITKTGGYNDDLGHFDYWTPIMSIPGILGVTLQNLPKPMNYLNADWTLQQQWLQRLGPKTRMRVGFCWSGRPDNWLNEHKGMPFETVLDLIKANPQFEWINLQIDASTEQCNKLAQAGVSLYPNTIASFADTAALIMAMDVVVCVDTAVAHLSAALGRPTWIMLNWFGTDWRYLLNRDDMPWYSTARLFRQPAQDDWQSVIKRVTQYLSWFKV